MFILGHRGPGFPSLLDLFVDPYMYTYMYVTLLMYFSLINNNLVFSDSGRRDPNVFKVIGLSASIDPPHWSRALQAAQKAKDLGILMGVMTRGEDAVS